MALRVSTGCADTGAARFLSRRPAIYSGPTPPSNSARNTTVSFGDLVQ
jgi:hypothetical protein